MKVICPDCREVFEFSVFSREGMKVECPKCRSLVFEKYKRIEILMFALAMILLVFVFLSNILTTVQLLLLLVGFVALEYIVRYAFVVMHNMRNSDFY